MKQDDPQASTPARSRRDFLGLAVATSAGVVTAALAPSAASAQPEKKEPPQTVVDDLPGTGEVKPQTSRESLRRGARFFIDCHVHAGSTPSMEKASGSIHSSVEWVRYRTEHPEFFPQLAKETMGDNSDRLMETMDRYGVTHALISSAGATTNEVIGEAARKHKGKLFPLYRPWVQQGAMWTGKMTFTDPKELAANSEQIVTDIRALFPKFGFIGLAEFAPGVVTMEVNPIKISRDLGPIM
jgi:hypothetical protein